MYREDHAGVVRDAWLGADHRLSARDRCGASGAVTIALLSRPATDAAAIVKHSACPLGAAADEGACDFETKG